MKYVVKVKEKIRDNERKLWVGGLTVVGVGFVVQTMRVDFSKGMFYQVEEAVKDMELTDQIVKHMKEHGPY